MDASNLNRHPGAGRGLTVEIPAFAGMTKALRMTYETLLVETRGAVTLVTLHGTKSRNEPNSPVLDDLNTAIAAFEDDQGPSRASPTDWGDTAYPPAPAT